MVSVNEAARTLMGGPLKAGVDTLSYNQTITFDMYVRIVLPLDGFVFWLRADQVTPAALLNVLGLNRVKLDQLGVAAPNTSIKVMGALHYATDQQQEQDATFATNNVIFTAENPVTDFNEVSPEVLWLGSFDGIRFAFSSRGSYFQQANLHHYVGQGIFSMFESQIIEDVRLLDTRELIVSNSLPAWLALNQYAPVYPVPIPQPLFPLFPSFLAPDNLPPIYGTVHNDPDSVEGLQGSARYTKTYSRSALVTETVEITLYGCSNALVMTFLDSIMQYQLDTGLFGITNIPIVMDDKRTQNELSVIAQKKRIVFEVNYYQQAMRDVARQLITKCVPTYLPQDDLQLITSVNVNY